MITSLSFIMIIVFCSGVVIVIECIILECMCWSIYLNVSL
jgi:hypothetical protein